MKPRTRTKKPPIAATADKYEYYRRAVQCTEHELEFIDDAYAAIRGKKKKPAVIREDFCSTANTCCAWVKHRPGNRAVGLDIDPEPLAWAERNNLPTLSKSQRARIDLRLQNVLTADEVEGGGGGGLTGFDAILAMNFSYQCFTERHTMLRYFTSVRKCLKSDGLFIMDHYGGSETYRIVRERKPQKGPGGGFVYFWDQAEHNPINGHVRFHITFGFKDGSMMRRAFTYDWRLWGLPELRDVLMDAGFKKTTVFWEGDDDKGGGDGVFKPTEVAEVCPSYITYIVAEP